MTNSYSNLMFEHIANADMQVTKTIGVIESVMMLNSRVFAVIRRTANTSNINFDPGEGFPLYNNPLSIEEDKLSPFELFVGLTNLDMNLMQADPSTFVGSFAEVSERNGIAFEAKYIGELYKVSDDPTTVAAKHIRQSRQDLSLSGQADDIEAVKQRMATKYGYKVDDVNAVFQYNFISDFNKKVITWNGEGYTYKDLDTELSFENKLSTLSILKYLNRTQMKTKNCHMFNKLFSGR